MQSEHSCCAGTVRATGVEHSRRFLRELDEASGGNNLQYILKCPCIPFFGNQGLHNETALGGNGGHSKVICERSPYIYPPPRLLHLEAMVPGLKMASKSVRQMCLGAAEYFQ